MKNILLCFALLCLSTSAIAQSTSPMASFSASSYSAHPNWDDGFKINVNLNKAPISTGTLHIKTVNVNAIPNTDYQPFDYDFPVAPGQTQVEILIPVVERFPPVLMPRTLKVELTPKSGVAVGSPNKADLTILPQKTNFTGDFADSLDVYAKDPSLIRTITGNEFTLRTRNSLKTAGFVLNAETDIEDALGLTYEPVRRDGYAMFRWVTSKVSIVSSIGTEYFGGMTRVKSTNSNDILNAFSVEFYREDYRRFYYQEYYFPNAIIDYWGSHQENSIYCIYIRQDDEDANRGACVIKFAPTEIPMEVAHIVRPINTDTPSINNFPRGSAIYGIVGAQGKINSNLQVIEPFTTIRPADISIEYAPCNSSGYVSPRANWKKLMINGQATNSVMCGDVANLTTFGTLAPANSWTFAGPAGWYLFRSQIKKYNWVFGNPKTPYEFDPLINPRSYEQYDNGALFSAYVPAATPTGTFKGSFTVDPGKTSVWVDDSRVLRTARITFKDVILGNTWLVVATTPPTTGSGFTATLHPGGKSWAIPRTVSYTIVQ